MAAENMPMGKIPHTPGRNEDVPKDKLFGLIDLDWRFELTKFKPIRKLFKSRWFPLLIILINLFMFTIILLAGFVGGYSSGNYNFGIMIVWILWWVMLMFVLVPGLARSWCLMCPFPIFSDWFQRRRLFGVKEGKPRGLNLRFPKPLRNMWLMNFIFLGTTFFSGFFTVRPFATFILLAGIILVATVTGLVFQKRSFCLYMCPVSGFQGLYSQFATSEIRRKDPELCKKHSPKTCFVGNEKGHGCPWLLTPFDFKKNTYCGMCLECFKTCPYDNMAFNLRPPGIDILVDDRREKRGLDEAWKAFIMLGISMVFFLTMQGRWGVLKDMVRATTLKGYLTFIASHSAFSLLIIPGVFFIFSFLSKIFSGDKEVSLKKVFTNFSYTLVPIGLGVWIAFSLGIILPNGSYILHILSDPFAWGWNLFGTANFPWTPVLTHSMGYLQGAALVVFYLLSLAYGFRLSKETYSDLKQSKRGWVPMFFFLTLMTIALIWIYLG
jgi:ferredoxin